jgi:hypothetical protein
VASSRPAVFTPGPNADRRHTRVLFGTLLTVALALPWGTGAVVKIYLDLHDLATYPWHYYLNPWIIVVYVVPSTLYWSSPLLVLLLLWRLTANREQLLRTTRSDRCVIVLAGFCFGAPAAALLFVRLFRDINQPAVPASRLPLLYLPYLLIGVVLGSTVAAFRVRKRVREAR